MSASLPPRQGYYIGTSNVKCEGCGGVFQTNLMWHLGIAQQMGKPYGPYCDKCRMALVSEWNRKATEGSGFNDDGLDKLASELERRDQIQPWEIGECRPVGWNHGDGWILCFFDEDDDKDHMWELMAVMVVLEEEELAVNPSGI